MGPEDEITCREFVELITDYFEGALEPQTLARTEEHLVMCDWCTTYAQQMRDTIAAVRTLGTETDGTDPHRHDHVAPALLEALRSRQEHPS